MAIALAAAFDASAVSLGVDGLGQALIYPYYTVRSSEGNPFNTYVSVVNHTSDAKAVRVRVREGILAKEVLSFNLYLSPNDAWTAAIVPTSAGASMLTTDTSCTDPAFVAGTGSSSLDFRNTLYTGSTGDGYGATLDRTREGYIEMIEMATLTAASRTAITHNAAGVPANCATIRGPDVPSVARPTGGLSGTLTLINVASGMDFTVNADALADLGTRQFFRPPTDPYPDFAASEIDPVSVVVANGQLYRSTWNRGVDAVSAALMRHSWSAEYLLDRGTASASDFVVTQPVRHHYVASSQVQPPYSADNSYSPHCVSESFVEFGERFAGEYFTREERTRFASAIIGVPPPRWDSFVLCAAAGVGDVRDAGATVMPDPSRSTVLGSTTMGLYVANGLSAQTFQNGWLLLTRRDSAASVFPPIPAPTVASLASSIRMDIATGTVISGAHTYSGLPIVGFSVRTFRNGTLACASGACQGNYGGAFPLKYTRRISP